MAASIKHNRYSDVGENSGSMDGSESTFLQFHQFANRQINGNRIYHFGIMSTMLVDMCIYSVDSPTVPDHWSALGMGAMLMPFRQFNRSIQSLDRMINNDRAMTIHRNAGE